MGFEASKKWRRRRRPSCSHASCCVTKEKCPKGLQSRPNRAKRYYFTVGSHVSFLLLLHDFFLLFYNFANCAGAAAYFFIFHHNYSRIKVYSEYEEEARAPPLFQLKVFLTRPFEPPKKSNFILKSPSERRPAAAPFKVAFQPLPMEPLKLT